MSINENDVREMMELSGQVPGDKTARLYVGLMVEEMAEVLEAEGYISMARQMQDFATALKNGLHPDRNRDHCSGFDGGIDVLWVTMGYMIARDYPIAEGWCEIASSNRSKRQPDGTLAKDVNGKIIKGPNYRKPDLASILIAQACME